MSITHNGEIVANDKNILLDKWLIESVCGDRDTEKPSFCVFNNTKNALELIDKHLRAGNAIGFHADVDVDGIGTTYIIEKAINALRQTKCKTMINKSKEHGILQKQADYFNSNTSIGLMIITDSSCNNIDIIKSFNCDVLCIDHHLLLHDDLYGTCNDGIHNYCIVNNTIGNYNQEMDNMWLRKCNPQAFEKLDDYIGTKDMSCGLVVYELMRIYSICLGKQNLMENLRLYQWVGITLITDAINTLNERNQWYLNKTMYNISEIEPTLNILINQLNKFKGCMSKRFINYKLAPIINKTIRAGESALALSTILNKPEDIRNLEKYAILQKEAIEKVLYIKDTETGKLLPKAFIGDSVEIDVSKYDVNRNYCGVIASRVSGDQNKNVLAYVYNHEKQLCEGSFRGRRKGVDYRSYIENFGENIYAQGHDSAFGVKVDSERLKQILASLSSIEPLTDDKPFITVGDMPKDAYGIYHADTLDDLRKIGYIYRIAVGNSKVASIDEVRIRVKTSDVTFVSVNEKYNVYMYDFSGLKCKSFEPINSMYADIYIEFDKEIEAFISLVK